MGKLPVLRSFVDCRNTSAFETLQQISTPARGWRDTGDDPAANRLLVRRPIQTKYVHLAVPAQILWYAAKPLEEKVRPRKPLGEGHAGMVHVSGDDQAWTSPSAPSSGSGLLLVSVVEEEEVAEVIGRHDQLGPSGGELGDRVPDELLVIGRRRQRHDLPGELEEGISVHGFWAHPFLRVVRLRLILGWRAELTRTRSGTVCIGGKEGNLPGGVKRQLQCDP